MFWRTYATRGVWTQLVDAESNRLEVVESNTDGLRNGPEPKSMRCADCGKRVANPDYNR